MFLKGVYSTTATFANCGRLGKNSEVENGICSSLLLLIADGMSVIIKVD